MPPMMLSKGITYVSNSVLTVRYRKMKENIAFKLQSESQERAKCPVAASIYLKSLMTGSWKTLKLHPNPETDVVLFKFKLLFSVWCKAGGLGVQLTVVGAMIDDKTYDPRVYYMNHTESNKVKAVAVFMS